MDEKPKSIWKKSWTGWRGLLLWLILFFVIFLFGLSAASTNLPFPWLFAIGLALAAVVLIACVRWLFCWRNFKRFLFDCACLATLIGLFYAEENRRGRHDWQKFKREWEAKGEHFDMAGVTPSPVPDDQNFAMTPIWVESMKAQLGPNNSRQWFGDKYADADGHTNFVYRLGLEIYHSKQTAMPDLVTPNLGSWQKCEVTDLRAWQKYYRISGFTNQPEKKTHFYHPAKVFTNGFPVAPQPQTPAQDVLMALSKHDAAIEELRHASALPASRFPLNYDSEFPGAILLPQLAALKRCCQTLQLRSIAELQNGQPEQALDDVILGLKLADKIRAQPFLISHLVRIAMLQITLQPVWEGLAERKWSDAQLVALDAELAMLDFFAAYKLSMDGELACKDGEMDYLRLHPEQLQNCSGGYYDDEGRGENQEPFLPGKFFARLIPTGWFYQNQFRTARIMVEHFIPVADVNQGIFSPALARHCDAVLAADSKSSSPFNLLERLMLPSLSHAARKFAYAQTSVDLARVAIAMERYRLAHGEYPELLAALAPQFMEKIPHDIINGEPLKYRRTDDGQFVLYSVGWNEKDDGGVVAFTGGQTPAVDISQGDWVWRYPAK